MMRGRVDNWRQFTDELAAADTAQLVEAAQLALDTARELQLQANDLLAETIGALL